MRPGVLGVGVGSRAKIAVDVTALLDADQFAAASAPADRPLLVLGSAGSGKTTVALHRLARIAARRERAPLHDELQVIVPDEGLARLSRRLLEPLGAGASQVRTLDAWFIQRAARVFGEALPRLCPETPALVSSLKRHPALFEALRARLARLPASSTTLPRMRRRLADAFTDRAFLAGVIDRAQGDLPRTAIEETVRHTLLQLAPPVARELASITDDARRRPLDGRPVDEGTPEALARTIDVDDLPILLSLRAWRGDATADDAAPIAHAVLDEAEDFALFELAAIGARLATPRGVTLAGDEAQQTSSSFAGWARALAVLGVDAPLTCRLGVSYRCPRPIAEAAQRILGGRAAAAEVRAARDGVAVGSFCFPHEAHAHLFVASAARELLDREPHASIGVLCRDEASAARVHATLADRPEARLVRHGHFTFAPGVDVADVESAKGLEFDYVIVPDATAAAYPQRDEARRLLHVAATRAAHQLWLVSGGAMSPIIARAVPSTAGASRGLRSRAARRAPAPPSA